MTRRKSAHDKHAAFGDAGGDLVGARLFLHGIVLQGHRSLREWQKFLRLCSRELGMKTAGKASIWRYPTAAGAGGIGMTIVQPITESFLLLDTWPDLGGAYLVVASCRPFLPVAIRRVAVQSGLRTGDCIGAPEMLRLR
jgi:hypothetical protein